MRDRGRRKWWVLGCLGLTAIVVLAVMIVAGLTWWSSRSADPRSSVFVHPSPEIDVNPLAGPAQRAAGDAMKILLELDSCEVYIEPSAPGEPLNVEAHYDAHDYRLEEIVAEEDPDTYHLRFVVTSSRLITGLKQGIRGGQPQLRIRLPLETPLDLTLVQRNGGAIVDLSGLHVLNADFDAGGALLKIDADEPLQGELERFTVKGRQGGLFVESLNLMRPKRVDVDFRMGQATLDFRGTWMSDTTVDLSMSVADAILRLPREARVDGLNTGPVTPSFGEELSPPTLTFSVESGTRTTLRVFE